MEQDSHTRVAEILARGVARLHAIGLAELTMVDEASSLSDCEEKTADAGENQHNSSNGKPKENAR